MLEACTEGSEVVFCFWFLHPKFNSLLRLNQEDAVKEREYSTNSRLISLVRSMRESRGLSQEELASLAGITKSNLAQLELGDTEKKKRSILKHLPALLDALEATTQERYVVTKIFFGQKGVDEGLEYDPTDLRALLEVLASTDRPVTAEDVVKILKAQEAFKNILLHGTMTTLLDQI